MVTSFCSSRISSSMRFVAIGSSAEVGSSISSTSGFMARARAMQRRCCCPPERNVPFLFNTSFTSSHKATLLSERSMVSFLSTFDSLMPFRVNPARTFSAMLMVGNGVGLWNTIPIRRRTSMGCIDRISWPLRRISPSTLILG